MEYLNKLIVLWQKKVHVLTLILLRIAYGENEIGQSGIEIISWTLWLLGVFWLQNYCSSPLILRQEEFKISSSFAAWPAENYEVLVASIIYKRIDASGMLNITYIKRNEVSDKQNMKTFSSNFFTPQLFLSMLSFQVQVA